MTCRFRVLTYVCVELFLHLWNETNLTALAGHFCVLRFSLQVFLKVKFILFYVYDCFASICVYVPHVCSAFESQERAPGPQN